MQILVFCSTIGFVLVFATGILVLSKNPKASANRLFAVLSFSISIWSFGCIFFVSARDYDEAVFWFRILSSVWALAFPLFIHFVLVLTKNRVFAKKPWLYLFLYLLVPYFTYETVVSLHVVDKIVKTDLGWLYYTSVDAPLVSRIYNVYLMSLLAGPVLLFFWYRKSSNPAHKKQGRAIIATLLLVVFLYRANLLIADFLGTSPLPFGDQLIMLVWQVGVAYAIVRYKLLVITPREAAPTILETMADGVLLLDRDGIIVNENPAVHAILKTEPNSLENRPMNAALPGMVGFMPVLDKLDDTGSVKDWELSYSPEKGGQVWLSVSASPIGSERTGRSGTVVVIRDITERKLIERQLEHMATHDMLTGLPNRITLNDRLRNAILRAERHKQIVAVMLVDVDRFKNINDSFGHDAGDAFLVSVAHILSESVREYDTVTRLGGDEFVILLTDLDHQDDCKAVIERIMTAILPPVRFKEKAMAATLSIGVSFYPSHSDVIEELYKYADIALYEVKASGRNGYRFYSAEHGSAIRNMIALELDLRDAAEKNQLELYFQPIYDIQTRSITAMESLVRWNHPQLGLVRPLDFIPFAERSGLILSIGEWVFKKVCSLLASWRENGLSIIPIAVNVSAKQFLDPEFCEKMENTLAAFGIEPGLIRIEITESTAMDEVEKTIANVRRLEERGLAFVIDDFGSGYSSMAWLKRLRIKMIKIDHLFIQNIESDSNDAAIVKAIVSMAHSMGISVVAEGIETEGQLDALKSMSWEAEANLACDFVQGYLFSKPVSASDAARFLETR